MGLFYDTPEHRATLPTLIPSINRVGIKCGWFDLGGLKARKRNLYRSDCTLHFKDYVKITQLNQCLQQRIYALCTEYNKFLTYF